MLQILINILWPIKIKTKLFGVSYRNHIFFYYYNDLIKLLQTFLVILSCWYKRHSICLISFFDFYELFPVFICANNIGSLVNNLFGVKNFNPFPSFTSSSSHSSGYMSDSSLSLLLVVSVDISFLNERSWLYVSTRSKLIWSYLLSN